MLRLEEYEPALRSQGYNSVEEVTQLTWEDLEDIGIVKLGHQKKIMLAIKRVKDINSGKRFSCLVNNNHKLFNEQCHVSNTSIRVILVACLFTSLTSFFLNLIDFGGLKQNLTLNLQNCLDSRLVN